MVTDAILDAARMRGDAFADATVAEIFKAGDTPAVARLFSSLMRDETPQGQGAAPVAHFLLKTGPIAARPRESVITGERVFAEHGPEVMMLLCCYSLPSSYAARKGVQVLHRTAYLAKRPNRRLFETAQFIIDVMSPRGLEPGGKGVRTAQKVRLMHAAIRHLILKDPGAAWSVDELGVPINQEDLRGTLMTFTWLILDGLQKLGAALTPQEQQAYLDAWLLVANELGIERELLPRTVAEAREVTAIIERRQVAESPEGREMMAALLGMMQSNLPRELTTLPAA